ncbi:hypothetical protein GCM10027186_15050 [Micromonospora schwarzwaldensis]
MGRPDAPAGRRPKITNGGAKVNALGAVPPVQPANVDRAPSNMWTGRVGR